MPHDSNKNESSSGPTSTSAPRTPPNKKPGGPASEAEFLARQAANAKAAIGAVVNDIKRDVTQGVDPRGWMQVAPWTTLGAAAVAGFLAAALAVPSKEEQTLKRLRKIEEALNPKRQTADSAVNGDQVRQVESGRGSFLSGLAGQVLRAVQPVLMSALTAGITAKTVDKDEPTGGGDPGDAAYGTRDSAPAGESPEI
jgi:hypothetical protein